MPRMNGIDFVKLLRNYIKNMSMKHSLQIQEPNFVFLTAYLTLQFKQLLEDLNVSAYYEKPLEVETLRMIFEDSRNQIVAREKESSVDF